MLRLRRAHAGPNYGEENRKLGHYGDSGFKG